MYCDLYRANARVCSVGSGLKISYDIYPRPKDELDVSLSTMVKSKNKDALLMLSQVWFSVWLDNICGLLWTYKNKIYVYLFVICFDKIMEDKAQLDFRSTVEGERCLRIPAYLKGNSGFIFVDCDVLTVGSNMCHQ